MTASAPSEVRVLLIEHQLVVRSGLRLLIERHPKWIVVGEAAQNTEAIMLAGREQPDVILLEPGRDAYIALDLLPKLHKAAQNARILLLTGLRDPQIHRQAIYRGAVGVVLKEQTADVLLKAIEKVFSGEVWIERVMLAHVLAEMAGVHNATSAPRLENTTTLTMREREVIMLLGEGLKNKQIAERLVISEITVRHYLTAIFAKLGVADRLELLQYAYRHGLAKLPRQ
jgi:DNA-binding NarL/FixJ family response regulator